MKRWLLAAAIGLCATPGLTKDTGLIFISLERGNEIVVLNPDMTEHKRIETSRRPRDMHFNAARDKLYVACGDDDVIDVIDLATLEIAEVMTFLPPGFRAEDVTPVGMAITNDGSKVIISLGRANHVAFVDVKSREVLAYALVGSRAWDVALSRDEATAYVANGLSDDITVIDMATMTPLQSLPVGRTPHSIRVDD